MALDDKDTYLAALAYEREGYVRSGKDDRIKQVDAEIARVKSGK